MVFCYQNCSDLLWEKNVLVIKKNFENFLRSLEQFIQSFSWSQEQFFLTVGQNNFGNKIPFVDFDGRYFKFQSLMKRLTYHARCCTMWLYLLKEILTINKQCLLCIAALNICAAAVVMIGLKPVNKVRVSLDCHGPISDLIKGDPD